MKRYPTTLIIAGSDSCGGAGIQADIKSCAALGVYAATAITAITAQNTQGVRGVQPVTPHMVRDQIVAVLDDLCVDTIKIGMLCDAAIATVVADVLSLCTQPIVLDPVMISTSGHKLLSDDAIAVIRERLFPLAEVVTPNVHEAVLLSGCDIHTCEDMDIAAHILLQQGCRAVLMKGGHLEGDVVVDKLYLSQDESFTFTSPRCHSHNTHGTGCTLASAIAAHRAVGYDLATAVSRSKRYVEQAIIGSSNVFVGHGHGSLNHAVNPLPLVARECK